MFGFFAVLFGSKMIPMAVFGGLEDASLVGIQEMVGTVKMLDSKCASPQAFISRMLKDEADL
jgi:hypothetical protein